MSRLRIVVLASLLAAGAAVLPVAGAIHLAWILAVQSEQDRLAILNQRLVRRASLTFRAATENLSALAASRTVPCTAEHLELMRRLESNSLIILEIGYFQDGILQCASWGIPRARPPSMSPALTTADGFGLSVNVPSWIDPHQTRLALQFGNYEARLEPGRFADVMTDSGTQLAVGLERIGIVASQNRPDPALLQALLTSPSTGLNEQYLFAATRIDGWIAIAIRPRELVFGTLERRRMLLLPIGAAISAIIIALILSRTRQRLSLLGELSAAVRKRQFAVHYQPIIELRSGICVGAEALVRWQQPDGSLVGPDLFMPIAEQSGLIFPITDLVVEAVVCDLGAALSADRTLHVAINLCAADMESGRPLDIIRRALERVGIGAEQIWLEATERGFLEIERARAVMTAARDRGHSIAIDDFGTGYSNLQYLQTLPIDALKIDKSFVDTIGRVTANAPVISHIIQMARSLELVCIAEGIETSEQFDYLLQQGVGFGQGWFFSKALPAAEFLAFYQHRKAACGEGPRIVRFDGHPPNPPSRYAAGGSTPGLPPAI